MVWGTIIFCISRNAKREPKPDNQEQVIRDLVLEILYELNSGYLHWDWSFIFISMKSVKLDQMFSIIMEFSNSIIYTI